MELDSRQKRQTDIRTLKYRCIVHAYFDTCITQFLYLEQQRYIGIFIVQLPGILLEESYWRKILLEENTRLENKSKRWLLQHGSATLICYRKQIEAYEI